jgi:hypothetical protein
MKWTQLLAGNVNAAFTRIMSAFGENAGTIIDSVIADEQVASRMANLLMNKGYEPTASHTKAREIMGTNFFGIEEAQKHFGLTLSKRQIAYMAEVPFSEGTLKRDKDTHILVAYPRYSIVSVRTKTVDIKLPKNHRLFYEQDWYVEDEVGSGMSALEWYLVRKTSVPDSKSKTWHEQKRLVDSTKLDEVPKADLMVYTIIGHFLETGERLFKEEGVRTNTFGVDGGDHVNIGEFDSRGLDIDCWDNNHHSDSIGIASVRKTEA